MAGAQPRRVSRRCGNGQCARVAQRGGGRPGRSRHDAANACRQRRPDRRNQNVGEQRRRRQPCRQLGLHRHDVCRQQRAGRGRQSASRRWRRSRGEKQQRANGRRLRRAERFSRSRRAGEATLVHCAGAVAARSATAVSRAGLLVVLALSACSTRRAAPDPQSQVTPFLRVEQAEEQSARELVALERKHLARPEQRRQFLDAAKAAWTYVDRHIEPATGWVAPLPSYPFSTIWDIGSSLGALYCARQLGFLDEPDYQLRMTRALETLLRIRLYDNRVFNKAYDARHGALLDARG